MGTFTGKCRYCGEEINIIAENQSDADRQASRLQMRRLSERTTDSRAKRAHDRRTDGTDRAGMRAAELSPAAG